MSARTEYLKLIETRLADTDIIPLIEWINDFDRKPAVLSFTEGPARQIAYAVESAIKKAETIGRVEPPLKLRPTERCPRCGYTQVVKARNGNVEC